MTPTAIISYSDESSELRVAFNEADDMTHRRLEEIGLHAAGLAHDLSNALTAVAAFSMFAKEAAGEGCPSRPYLARIEESVALAVGLCRQLTNCAGSRQMERGECDLNLVVKDTLRAISTKTEHAEISVELADNAHVAGVNTIQMSQVIMNLVLNAADALDALGGTIQISTDHELILGGRTLCGERVSEIADGSYVRIDVRDNGRGMPDSVKAHIFEPFFTTKKNGHGIGLSSVASIVRSYKGAIMVNSAAGLGTKFSVFIPTLPSPRVERRDAA